MSKVAIAGNPSGTATFTIESPATNTDRTLVLPDVSATLITNSAGILNIGSGQIYKDASGNVGIGTSSPATQMELAKNNTAGTALNVLRFTDTDTVASANQPIGAIEFFTSDVSDAGVGAAIRALGGVAGVGSAKLAFDVAGSQVLFINTDGQQSSTIVGASGVYPEYKCRAWVNFNGTTSPGTIRASGNVSSVTRNSTGVFTINFATAMPDANFAVVCGDANSGSNATIQFTGCIAKTSSTAQVVTNAQNLTLNDFAVFR
jgi:hypothetical protein